MIKFITLEKFQNSRFTFESVPGAIGSFMTKLASAEFYLFPLDEFDLQSFKHIKLKDNEKIFRYETETTRISNMKPLIKINMISGLVYYFDITDDDSEITFETRGVKPLWISILEKY